MPRVLTVGVIALMAFAYLQFRLFVKRGSFHVERYSYVRIATPLHQSLNYIFRRECCLAWSIL